MAAKAKLAVAARLVTIVCIRLCVDACKGARLGIGTAGGTEPLQHSRPPSGHAFMKVRYGTTNDVSALAALGSRIHAETRFAAYDYSMMRVQESLHSMISLGQNERGTNCVLIAEDDHGNIAGILIGVIERHIFSDLPVASVMVYYVFPDKRMSGAGFRLITAFRKWADNRAAFEICVGITSALQLHRTDRFLTRIGFERTGGNYSLQSKSERPSHRAAPYD